eukprot:5792188-Karenia_brevis.AAC.1
MKVLGAHFGHPGAETEAFRQRLGKVKSTREGVASLDDPASELILTRQCLDVAKVGYNMRCSGDRLQPEVLREFDMGL